LCFNQYDFVRLGKAVGNHHSGRRRRFTFVAAVTAALIIATVSIAAVAVATSGSAPGFPTPVAAPAGGQPATAVDIVVGRRGELTPTGRRLAPCDAPFCPLDVEYTTIAPGSTAVALSGPGRNKTVTLSDGLVTFTLKLDAKHQHPSRVVDLHAGPYLVATRNTQQRFVLWVMPDPYTPPTVDTTVPNTLDTTVPTTFPQLPNDSAMITFDDAGVHSSKNPMGAGYDQLRFSDQRTNRTGLVVLHIYVHPHLGEQARIPAGEELKFVLCPHDWIMTVTVDGVDAASAVLTVGGTSSLCTTPIT
jgi:hypothetical protein